MFISLANGDYIEALIAQGAIDLLLTFLRKRKHDDYCRRIQVRTTRCLRIIANHGIGLKAIHEKGDDDSFVKIFGNFNLIGMFSKLSKFLLLF